MGGSLLGKQSLGYFKAVMCHAAHGPVRTRLSLHKPVHIMNGYHGPQLSIKAVCRDKDSRLGLLSSWNNLIIGNQ